MKKRYAEENMYYDIINLLRNIEPIQLSDPHKPPCESIQEQIAQLPTLETKLEAESETEKRLHFQNNLLPDLLSTYLYALKYSLEYIGSLPSSKLECSMKYSNCKDSSDEIKQRLIFSPFKDLFFPDEDDIDDEDDDMDDEDDDIDDEDDDIDDEDDEDTNEMTSSNVIDRNESFSCRRINNYIPFKFPKVLSTFAYALRKSICFCPYSIYPKSFSPYCKDGKTIDKRKTSPKFSHDYTPPSITMEQARKDSRMLATINDELLHALLELNGSVAVDFFNQKYDITYNNPNIKDYSKITKFYKKIYLYTITSLTEMTAPEHLFNLFTLETVFNGSFLIYFCESFSAHPFTNIRKKLSDFNNSDNKRNNFSLLSKIYQHINRIENPFIKHEFLDEIIKSTFYEVYTYGKDRRCAGKYNIIQWCDDICEYSDAIASMECQIYKSYLLYTSSDMPSKSKIIQKYYELFQKSYIYLKDTTSITHSQSDTYKKLLPQITQDNYKYYPLENHPLFYSD